MFVVATDERARPVGSDRVVTAIAIGDSLDREHFEQLIDAFDLMMTGGADVEQVADELASGLRDADLARRGNAFDPRCSIRCVTEGKQFATSATDFVDDHWPAVNADPGLEVHTSLAEAVAEPLQRLVNREPGANRPFRIVLVSRRKTEVRHDSVALHLRDIPTVLLDGARRLADVGLDQIRVLLRVEPLSNRCRSDEIAKQQCQTPFLPLWPQCAAIGIGLRLVDDDGRRRRSRRLAPHRSAALATELGPRCHECGTIGALGNDRGSTTRARGV